MSDQESQHDETNPTITETPMSLTDQLRKAQYLLSDDYVDDETTTTAAATSSTTNNPHPNNHHQQSIGPIDPPSVRAVAILEHLQEEIQRSSLFSTNESLDDVQTSSLLLIATEYYLGKAYLKLPTVPPSSSPSSIGRGVGRSSTARSKYVSKAVEFFHLFLERCNLLEGLLEDDVANDYQSFLRTHNTHQTHNNGYHNDTGSNESNGSGPQAPPRRSSPLSSSSSTSRDAKIARYRRTQTLRSQTKHLDALLSRRQRLQIPSHEDLEGHDEESLHRSLSVSTLNLSALDCLDELDGCSKELEMLVMAVEMEKRREAMTLHTTGSASANGGSGGREDGSDGGTTKRRMRQPQRRPMDLTHVTQNPNTGQLVFRKEQVRSTVFRPSWNQPTMTLDELAEKEVRDAMLRSEQQKEAEEAEKLRPRRYDQLVRDGMEDDEGLVEASAALDRKWDDWKDANPRGSGNKMGDVGDRNF